MHERAARDWCAWDGVLGEQRGAGGGQRAVGEQATSRQVRGRRCRRVGLQGGGQTLLVRAAAAAGREREGDPLLVAEVPAGDGARALRTGTYSKTLTFNLTTTQP